MKKLILFFMIAGIALGLFFGIRFTMVEEQEENVETLILDSSYKDELNLPFIEVDSFNPILTKNKQIADTLKLVYEPLVDIDASNQLIPALATEWMEKDDVTWIVSLRKNVKWHSQRAFSIEDIIFTINEIKRNEDSSYFFNVANIVETFALDDNTLCISLKEKDALLPYKLTFPIIPCYYYRDSMEDLEKAKRPIGTGPYQYDTTSDDGMRITLKANTSWWKSSERKLETIYLYVYKTYGEAIKAFKSSEIDVITTSMVSWEKKFGLIGINNYRYENEKFETVIPNCKRVALQEPSVRRAILYGINRANIIEEVYKKNANKQDIMIHNYSWVYEVEETLEYSPEKAKQLLTNALWKQTANGWSKVINGKSVNLKFNLMVYQEDEEKYQVAEKIKQDLENIGIPITIQKVGENNFYQNIEADNFDLALATITCRNEFDILELLTNEAKNYANYDNIAMKESLNQLYLTNLSLHESFQELQKKYKAEVPYIGLYFKTDVLLTNKAVKGNIVPTWWNPYHHVETWCK